MKQYLIITFLLVLNLVFAQTKLELSLVDSCSEEELEEYDFIMLCLDCEKHTEYWFGKDSIVNIEKGAYSVLVNAVDGNNFKSYDVRLEFKTDSVYSVNLEMPRIIKKYTREIHNSTDLGFYNCNEICDGLQRDFYANGKMRIEGEFKNGIPVKQLRKYNESGDLVEIELYRRNGTYKRTKYLD